MIMHTKTWVDVARGYGFHDLDEIQSEYNRLQINCRGKQWPGDIPIPFREFQDLLERQIHTYDPENNPECSRVNERYLRLLKRIIHDTLATRVLQAITLLKQSPRQYEVNEDLYTLLDATEWDGRLDLDLLNQMPADCIALRLPKQEKGKEHDYYWFVFRDRINTKKPVLIVVGVIPPKEGTDGWHSYTYEIPFSPGRIRENMTENDLRFMITRYGTGSFTGRDKQSEQQLFRETMDDMMRTLMFVIPVVHHICASPLDMIESGKSADFPIFEIKTRFMDIVKAVRWRYEAAKLYASADR